MARRMRDHQKQPRVSPDTRTHVLVTDGGSGQGRSALAAVRALNQGGYRPIVGVTGPGSLAAASRFCASAVPTPMASDPDYAEEVRELSRSLNAQLVLASDAALVALRRPEAALVDKALLEERCERVRGLTVPPSITVTNSDELHDAALAFDYPVILKPSVSTRPPEILRSGSDVTEAGASVTTTDPGVVQPFLAGPLDAVSGVIHEGRLVAVVHQRALRTWPAACGPSCAAITVERDVVREEGLRELLADHEGIFQAQFLGAHLIDLNPRVYGSLSLAVAAGVNLLALTLDPPPVGTPLITAAPNVRYRWFEGDIRHAISQRGQLGPLGIGATLMPRPGTAHSIWSRADPKPFAARLRYAQSRR